MMEGDPSTTLRMTKNRRKYMEHELIAIKNNTTNPLHLAISTLLPGLADFRRKKHGNLCTYPS
jgi:hypothetical protein